MFKSGDKVWGEGGGGKFWRKKYNVTNAIPKWIYVASFIQIGRWESVQNWGKIWRLNDGRTEEPALQSKTTNLRLRNLFSKRNFDTGFQINFVSTMDISPYTQSNQRKIAEKHLARLAENGIVEKWVVIFRKKGLSMAVVAAIGNPSCGRWIRPVTICRYVIE